METVALMLFAPTPHPQNSLKGCEGDEVDQKPCHSDEIVLCVDFSSWSVGSGLAG